jgi:tetratricopeptide (TPR) repeat protein
MSSKRARAMSIFLSSTFQDMKKERDILIKDIFKGLRSECESRGVNWSEIDLRWGITEEEASDGKILPICFYAIDKSRPYFLCMIGGRYGSILDRKPTDLIKQEKWLEDCWNMCSITELEILYGVLKKPELAKNAFFYFKTINQISTAELQFSNELSIKDKNHLDSLKEKIRIEQSKYKNSISITPYTTAEELGDLVKVQLSAVIDEHFPKDSIPDPIEKERQEHENFAETRIPTYYPRPRRRYEKRLTSAVENKKTPLVITGASGSGKTSLIANWLSNYRPDNAYVITYFVGVTSKSTSCSYMLHYIISNLKKKFDLEGEVPADFGTLKTEFIHWLQKAGKCGNILIVIDALNQLDRESGVHNLSWLPSLIPNGISLIVSTLPGDIENIIIGYKWKNLRVELLKFHEKKGVIKKYLNHYHKNINVKEIEKIASVDAAENPLYLCSLLEELRIYGDHLGLSQLLYQYLTARDTVELFTLILNRWAKDYGNEKWPGIIENIFRSIWASRKGLSSTEICEFLGNEEGPLPHLILTRLLFSTDRALISRDTVINFSHDFIRQAVEYKYLNNEDAKREIHFKLAKYFEKISDDRLNQKEGTYSHLTHFWEDDNKRKLEELPWQYLKAERWDNLVNYLTNPGFYKQLWNHDTYDVRNYWSTIEEASNKKITASTAYKDIIENLKDYDPTFILSLSRLFELRDADKTAYPLYLYLKKEYYKIRDCRGYASVLGKIGWVMSRQNKVEEAMILYNEQEEIARKNTGEAFQNILQISLNYQALVLQNQKKYEEALKLLEEKERICKELGNHSSLQIAVSNRGLILYNLGQKEEGLKCFEEQETICNYYGFTEGLHVSYGRQSMYYQSVGKYSHALEYQLKKEQICRSLKIDFGLATSLASKGEILEILMRKEESVDCFKEGLELSRLIGNRDAEKKCTTGLERII